LIQKPLLGNLHYPHSDRAPNSHLQRLPETPSPRDRIRSVQITQQGPNTPPGETENSAGVNKVMLVVLTGNLHQRTTAKVLY